jgi:hypothetical protein
MSQCSFHGNVASYFYLELELIFVKHYVIKQYDWFDSWDHAVTSVSLSVNDKRGALENALNSAVITMAIMRCRPLQLQLHTSLESQNEPIPSISVMRRKPSRPTYIHTFIQ